VNRHKFWKGPFCYQKSYFTRYFPYFSSKSDRSISYRCKHIFLYNWVSLFTDKNRQGPTRTHVLLINMYSCIFNTCKAYLFSFNLSVCFLFRFFIYRELKIGWPTRKKNLMQCVYCNVHTDKKPFVTLYNQLQNLCWKYFMNMFPLFHWRHCMNIYDYRQEKIIRHSA
jgi:hypothetical protein